MKRILILLATLTLSAASAHGNEGKPVGQLRARDAHALLWLPDGRLLFGHHDGVQVSPDQGSTWKKLFDKPDFDAMNLQLAGRSIILAGHGVYATSPDGKRWMNRTPKGLGGKDLHGYAVDPGNAARHYAWEAGTGLYGSTDSGATWRPLTAQKLPPDVKESNLATKQSANAVVGEAEKLVKEFCDAGGAAKRKNLAAWMQRLYRTEGFHDDALEMVYKVATGGKALPEPKKR